MFPLSRQHSFQLNQTMAQSQLIPCLLSLILISLLVFPLAADTPMRRRKKSLDTIKSLNQNGPYLGLITIYPPEEAAFFATGAFRPHPIHPFVDLSGSYIVHTNTIFMWVYAQWFIEKFEGTHKFIDTCSHPPSEPTHTTLCRVRGPSSGCECLAIRDTSAYMFFSTVKR